MKVRNLGRALQSTGNVAEALSHLGRAAASAADAEPHYQLALALLTLGRYRQCIPHLERALGLNPAHGQAGNDLAVARLRMNDEISAASSDFERAIQLRPGLVTAHINQGNLACLRGEVRRALAHWRDALKAKPTRRRR